MLVDMCVGVTWQSDADVAGVCRAGEQPRGRRNAFHSGMRVRAYTVGVPWVWLWAWLSAWLHQHCYGDGAWVVGGANSEKTICKLKSKFHNVGALKAYAITTS